MPYGNEAKQREYQRQWQRKYRERERAKLAWLKEWNNRLRELCLDTDMKLLEARDDEKKRIEILERHMKYVHKLLEIYDKQVEPKKKKRTLRIKL